MHSQVHQPVLSLILQWTPAHVLLVMQFLLPPHYIPLSGLAHFWAGCKSLVQKCWFYAGILSEMAVPMPIASVVVNVAVVMVQPLLIRKTSVGERGACGPQHFANTLLDLL